MRFFAQSTANWGGSFIFDHFPQRLAIAQPTVFCWRLPKESAMARSMNLLPMVLLALGAWMLSSLTSQSGFVMNTATPRGSKVAMRGFKDDFYAWKETLSSEDQALLLKQAQNAARHSPCDMAWELSNCIRIILHAHQTMYCMYLLFFRLCNTVPATPATYDISSFASVYIYICIYM